MIQTCGRLVILHEGMIFRNCSSITICDSFFSCLIYVLSLSFHFNVVNYKRICQKTDLKRCFETFFYRIWYPLFFVSHTDSVCDFSLRKLRHERVKEQKWRLKIICR